MSSSFDDILAEHGPTISRIVANYAGPGAGREDLRQDVWLAIWRAHKRFRGESSLRTYVLRIAHNRCATWLSRQRKLSHEEEVEVVDKGGTPEEATSGRQEVERLMKAIRMLPLNQRQVISLVLEGLSYREVGEVLGLTENTVGVRVHRARQGIRRAMERGDG